MHCRLTYNESIRGIMPSDQDESTPCCHMGPIHALFFCIIRIISLLTHYYTYYFKFENDLRVHIHCRKLSNQHIHHRGSVSIQIMLIRFSIINLQQALSHVVSFRNRTIRIGLADVRQPSSTRSRFELVTQSIDSRGND
jgi:hypothetical protein